MVGASCFWWRAGLLRILHIRVRSLSAQSGLGNGPGGRNGSGVAAARLDHSRYVEFLAPAKPLYRNRPVDDRADLWMCLVQRRLLRFSLDVHLWCSHDIVR